MQNVRQFLLRELSCPIWRGWMSADLGKIERAGYKAEDMVVLTDDQRDPRSIPTRQNMTAAMHWLVSGAQPGDALFFHVSLSAYIAPLFIMADALTPSYDHSTAATVARPRRRRATRPTA